MGAGQQQYGRCRIEGRRLTHHSVVSLAPDIFRRLALCRSLIRALSWPAEMTPSHSRRRHRSRAARLRAVLPLLLAALVWPSLAQAYIGPGAGFAFAGSLAVLVAAFALAIGTILLWPFTFLYRMIRVGNPFKHASAKRVIILGFDGMDPGLATRFIREGRLPNMKAMADRGVFRPLDTSNPSMSPVAWSTFATGVDPSGHGIYDFLTRDPCTYAPLLSSTDIGQATRVLNIGKYVVPLS